MRGRGSAARAVAVASAGALWLAACQSYHRLPLAAVPALAASLAALRHEGVDVGRPLSVADVASLAVQNDPALLAERGQRGLARAQLLQAGLLPNPSINPDYAFNAYAPYALNQAWTVAISYDLRALLLRPTAVESARDAARQVDAQLLWQEWQVAGQARLLAVDLMEGCKLEAVLDRSERLLASRYGHSSAAMAQGNATLATVAPDLNALGLATEAREALERMELGRRQQLAALFGLQPSVPIRLAREPGLPPFQPDAIRARLSDLAAWRPDLVALRMGYASEDAKVRSAIIGQFPALVLGIVGGLDNTHDYTVGPQPNFDLPIFNHNQGQIAIERASRQLLHDQYAARLKAADGDVRAVLDSVALDQRQRVSLARQAGATEAAAVAAERAWRAGAIDELTYVTLAGARLDQEQRLLALEQSILDAQVAASVLTGAGLPPLVPGGRTVSLGREAKL